MPRGPLAGRWFAAAAMVMCALIPYLGLSAALQPLTPVIAKQLHMSLQTMSLASGMANAAYAVGTVLAVQFAQHLPQRRITLAGSGLIGLGVGAAVAPALFIAGFSLRSDAVQRVFAITEPAWDSPPLLAAVRRRTLAPVLVAHVAEDVTDHDGAGSGRARVTDRSA